MPEIDWAGEERRARDRRGDGAAYEVFETCACDQRDRIHAIQGVVEKLSETIDDGEAKLSRCKIEVDNDIKVLHEGMALLNTNVETMQSDMHQFAKSTAGMQDSVATIANNFQKLVDNLEEFPEAWRNFRGFLKTVMWLRTNWILMAIIVLVLSVTVWPAIKEFMKVVMP